MLIKTLLVKLGLDAGDYNQGLEAAQEKTTGAVGSIVSGLSSVGGAVVMGALGIATAGVVALGTGLGIAVTEAMGAQEVMAQTMAVIESTGGAAGMTAEQVAEMATALSLQSRFSDDAIQTGQNLLLTFTNIGEETFPLATQAMVDMATAMGTDVKSGAIQLGKALNDPIAGISALSRVGVTFTEDQKAVIEQLVATGDVAGAQAVILAELNKEFGGSAAAAAETFGGKLDVLKNRLLNVAEGIGMQLLPILTLLFDSVIAPAVPVVETIGAAFGDFIAGILSGEDPVGDLANLLWSVATALGLDGGGVFAAVIALREPFEGFVAYLQENVPKAFEAFQAGFAWLMENEGVIVGLLAALGVAVVAFAATSIAALAPVVASMAPIILVMVAIGAAVALLYTAWTDNWGGIRDVLTGWWTETGQPIFDQIRAWLEVNIPLAIEVLKSFWEVVLLPAIQSVWAWIQGTLFPLLGELWTWLGTTLTAALTTLGQFWTETLLPAISTVRDWVVTTLVPMLSDLWAWLQETIPAAITTLESFWTDTLLPAIQGVWTFIQDDLVPLFQALLDFWAAAFNLGFTAMVGLWQNILLPALQAVGAYISDSLQPVFAALVTFWTDTLEPKLTSVKTGILDALPGVFQGIRDAVGWVTEKLGELTSMLNGITLPWWLTPGSPTPWELGLRGISSAMDELNRRELPRLTGTLRLATVPAGVAAGGGVSHSRTNQLTVHYAERQDEGSVAHTLRLLDRLEGP